MGWGDPGAMFFLACLDSERTSRYSLGQPQFVPGLLFLYKTSQMYLQEFFRLKLSLGKMDILSEQGAAICLAL